MSDLVVRSRDGEIGIITINNPPVNALSPGVPEGIAEAIREFNADPAVQAIVLIGGGRTFIAGADIKEFGKITSGKKEAAIGLAEVCLIIEDSAKPVTMAIHGTALGGGLETAMAGHYRVAVASAQVGQPEVKLGIIPGAAGTQRLPRLAGLPIALEMCVYGAPISATAALDCGILDDVIMGDLLVGAVAFARGKLGLPFTKVRDRQEKLVDDGAIAEARTKLDKRGRSLLAETRAIDAIEAATQLDFLAGCAKEAEYFKECLFSNQSKGMIHSFFGERAVAKVPGIDKDTPVLPVNSVAVIGAGTMGAGIAMVYANAGIPVLLKETTQEALDRGLARIRVNYNSTLQKGRLTPEEMEARLGRITGTLTYEGFADVDLITEAVFENMALKQSVFVEIDAVARPGCILATNTSTLDIDAIAAVTKRPEWVIGTHFFSPANVMRLLEIVRGSKSSPTAQATAMALAKRLKKTGVMVGNCFGFVGNRMFGPYRREAELLVQEGATPQQVDAALYNFGMAMGPLATGDLAGLDVGWRVRQENPKQFEGVRQPVIEDRLVAAGRYGQKTGQGWYLYDASRRPQPDPFVLKLIEEVRAENGMTPRSIAAEEIVQRTIYALINEGARILEEGFALRSVDIDMIWVMGYGFPAWRGGPMFYADTVGLSTVVERMRKFGWTPAPLLLQLAESGGRFTDWQRP
jgi:3-hydroxyacyl-CoA dehydrogenase